MDTAYREWCFRHVLISVQSLLAARKREDEITVAMRDANQLSPLMPVVEQFLEGVTLI